MSVSSAEYKIGLMEPNSCGYVVVSIQSDPDSVASDVEHAKKASIQTGTHSSSTGREKLHREVEGVRAEIGEKDGVLTASLFEAIFFHHGTLKRHAPYGREGARIARYDNVLIVKTESIDRADQLRSEPVFEKLLSSLRSGAKAVDVFTARNVKRAADVDRSREGCFLINYFFTADVDPLLDIWDRTAGWWETEGQMANSELLRPLDSSNSDYAIVNTARWDDLAPALDAFSKKSLDEFVLANIDAHHATTMPTLYRLVAS